MTIHVSDWNAADYLETVDDMTAYLNAITAEDDPALLQAALGDVANARGMSALAQEIGACKEIP